VRPSDTTSNLVERKYLVAESLGKYPGRRDEKLREILDDDRGWRYPRE